MNLTFNTKIRVPVITVALGVLSLLLLSSCGSKEWTRIKCGSFEYEDVDVILPRTFIVHSRVFGGELSYHEQMKLPVFRFGLVDTMWIVDVKSAVIKVSTFLGMPFGFSSSNVYSVTPTTNTTDYSELLEHEQKYIYSITRTQEIKEHEQELIFDPNQEAIE